MSLFICAHGELYCNCKYCNDFIGEEINETEDDENKAILAGIVQTMKKEKIEY